MNAEAPSAYQPLSVETLGARLGAVPAIVERLGADARTWRVREVGDGNLNLVFIVESPKGALVVKQALPYVRLVGESWPLPLKRTFFEYHALTRQAARDPGRVPNVYFFDERQSLIAMEYLNPHVILRRSLEAGVVHEKLGEQLGLFLARTLFRGSDLSMKTAERKADLALFADNVALCDITEALVFTDPYYAAKLNRHTSPELDGIVAELRADVDLKVAAQHLKLKFCNHAETLLHGDLHTGSIMAHGDEARVIDSEFAVYGPFGFDVGMLIANFLMAFFAQSGYETPRRRARRISRLDSWRHHDDLECFFDGIRASLADRARGHSLPTRALRGSGPRSCRGAGADRSPAQDLGGRAGLCGRRNAPAHSRPRPYRRVRAYRRSRTARALRDEGAKTRASSRGQPQEPAEPCRDSRRRATAGERRDRVIDAKKGPQPLVTSAIIAALPAARQMHRPGAGRSRGRHPAEKREDQGDRGKNLAHNDYPFKD